MSPQSERAAAALARFDGVLRSMNHPLVDALRPGASADEIHAAVEPTGMALPDEAVELWRWRNGLDPAFTADRAHVPGSEMLPGGVRFLSIAAAVQDYLRFRDEHWFDGDRTDLSSQWFPFGGYTNGDMMWIDCSAGRSDPAPLIYWYLKDQNPPDQLAARTVPSVARGVEIMTALIERGIWTLVGPGDTVTFDGTSLVIGDGATPRYNWVRDRDDDLPASWP